MDMLKQALDVTADKRAALEEYDRRRDKRMVMVDERKKWREVSPTFGNRKERRRQVALERQGKENA